MVKDFKIPPQFSLVKKGNISLLLKEEYKNFLLQQGIDDPKSFLRKKGTPSPHRGRISHPVLPLRGENHAVIRQYVHGGLLGNFMKHVFFFGSRSFQELALTEEIRSTGIPTVLPIAAIHQRIFLCFYHAYLLSLEVPEAIDLIQYFQEMGTSPSCEIISQKRKMIRRIGLLIRKLHQEGFFHGDLQMKNILISGDQILLLDFDRSYRKNPLTIRERMKNLIRLNRSAEKWKRLGLAITRTDAWRFFLSYAGEDQSLYQAMVQWLKAYSVRLSFYRFGWRIEKIFRK